MPAFPKMKQKKTYTNVKYLLEPIFIKKVIIDIGTFYKPISKNRSSLDLNQKKVQSQVCCDCEFILY